MVPIAANAAPVLFRTLTRAGFAREIGQIQRATNIYAMSFNLVMIVLQAVYENQRKSRKKNAIANELTHVKQSVRDVDGSEVQAPGSKYSEVEKAFKSMSKKLEGTYKYFGSNPSVVEYF